MGVLDSIAERFVGKPQLPRSVSFKVEGVKVKEEVAALTQQELGLQRLGVKHPFNYELYEGAYLSVPIVKAAIDKITEWAVGNGFYLEAREDDELGDSSKLFLEDWINKTKFQKFIKRMTRDMLVFGSSFAEKVWMQSLDNVSTGELIGRLKPHDPKKMYVKIDEYQRVTGYTLQNNQANGTPLLVDDVVHFAWNPIGYSPYGTSDLRALFGNGKIGNLQQYLDTQNNISRILSRKAGAPIIATMGTDEHPANPTDIANMASDLQASKNDTEWVVSHYVKFDALGFADKIVDQSPYLQHFERQVIYALQVPEVLLGKGSVPEGLAKAQMEAFKLKIEAIQAVLEEVIEREIFKPLLLKNGFVTVPDIVWNKVLKDEDAEEIAQLLLLINSSSVSQLTKTDAENKIRTILKMPGQVTAFDAPQPAPAFGGQSFGRFSKKTKVKEMRAFYSVQQKVAEEFGLMDAIRQFLSAYTFDLLDATLQQKNELRSALQISLDEGEGIPEVVDRIAPIFGGDKNKAELVARSEIAKIENESALMRYDERGLQKAEFLTAEDDRVDEDCMALNGKVYSLEDAAGVIPVHPRCRCTWLPVLID